MTSLVLGVAGAAVGGALGGAVGAQIGWLAGSLLANLIDPPKVQGPRLGDTKLQKSTYGAMIPYVWGHGRLGTLVIDQTDLVEHKHKSGGKGGPEVTNYTYSASWIAALCAKLPNRDSAILGITDLWMDGRLVWSVDDGKPCPCTVYLGDETQVADPTFEAIHGVGQQPGYRALAYLTFTDLDLTDYGNRIPNVEAAVYTAAGDFPWRVSTFTWTDVSVNRRQVIRDTTTGHIRIFASGGTGDTETKVSEYKLDGTQVGSTLDVTLGGVQANFWPDNLNVFNGRIGPGDAFWYTWDDDLQAWQQGLDISASQTSGIGKVSGASMYKDGYIYAVGGGVSVGLSTYRAIVRIACPSGVPGDYDTHYVALDDDYAASSVFFGHSNDEYVYAIAVKADLTIGGMWRFDQDLNIVHHWSAADLAGTHIADMDAKMFHVYNNIVAVNAHPSSPTFQIGCTRINGDNTLTDVGVTLTKNDSQLWDIGYGYGVDQTGVYCLNPPPTADNLGAIVADICSLTPASTVDVTELTDPVRWYVVGQEMTARNALEKLRTCFFFDGVEIDYGLKFVKRGDRTVYEIPDADLCGRGYDEDQGDPLRTVRKREQELPRTVTMTYIDVDMDYQTGAQSSPRQVTQSQYDVSLEAPIGFTASEAAQVCWTVQCAEWNERESFQWATTLKWAHLTPTDLAKVRGRIVRIQKVTESPDGIVSFEGVLAAPSLYTQVASGSSSGGVTAQEPASGKPKTSLVLLDIPVLTQGAYPFGFYAALAPAQQAPWPGAALYKSLDGGTTYDAVVQTTTRGVIGHTTSSLSTYALGDVVDESTITVVLHDPDATLDAINATALTNGGNLAAIRTGAGWEIVGFRDATLTAPSTYDLTGFKRGRFSTVTSGHADGDTFVLLSSTVNVDAPEIELNQALKYKAVTYGNALADATAVTFTNTGEGAEAYYNTEQQNLPVATNPQTGTSYTITLADRAKLITFNNAAAIAVSIPDSFPNGWYCYIENIGAGTVTLTPGAWNIDTSGAVAITTDHGLMIASNGSKWSTMRGMGGGGTGGTPTRWDGVFGDGRDGAFTLDGTTNYPGIFVLSGGNYTMSRSVSCTNLTINAGVSLLTNATGGVAGALFVNGTLTLNGIIDANGANASGITGGTAPAASYFTAGSGGGSVGAGGSGLSDGAIGGLGGAGGAATGAPATGGGFAGGVIASSGGVPTIAAGGLSYAATLWAAVIGLTRAAGRWGGGTGGGGGTVGGTSGGGGAGGSPLAVLARFLAGNGTIRSNGGNGANATGGNSGGGGGGGGGPIWLVTSTANPASILTIQANGGSPGTGTGTGRAGVAGGNGPIYTFVLD